MCKVFRQRLRLRPVIRFATSAIGPTLPASLERLSRTISRPAIAHERLGPDRNGRVVLAN